MKTFASQGNSTDLIHAMNMLPPRLRAYYICGTHWDREWYEPFQEYRMWLVQNLDEILDRLAKDEKQGVFHLDGQSVLLEDYLEIRPERREELCALLKSGRLIAGPWYAMPDLWLVSGEALIRNFTRGMRVVRAMGAEPMQVGYCPDLFGHIASMPMIFSGLGFRGAVVWRGLNDDQVRSQFFWVGPDGSRILTHRFPDNFGYGWVGGALRHPWKDGGRDPSVLEKSAPACLAEEAARGDAPVLFLNDGGDHQPMPFNAPLLLDQLRRICPDIEFVQAGMEEYFNELHQHADLLQEFNGEIRFVARKTGKWFHALIPHCLASRYPLKHANDRCQNLLTLWAEPFAALALAAGCPLAPGFLDQAWKCLLQNQPHDSICGCSVDETHADMPYRYHQAMLLGDGVMRQAMAALAPVSSSSASLDFVTVWNPLARERKCIGEIELLFPPDYAFKAMRTGHMHPVINQFELIDPEGRAVPYQLLSVQSARKVKLTDSQGRRQTSPPLDVYKMAVSLDLPSVGFTTLRVRGLEGDGAVQRKWGSLRTGPLSAQNEHLRVSLSAAGAVTLEHLSSGRIFSDLFQYDDSGDRGDGWNYIAPVHNPTLVSSGRVEGLYVEEDGPLQITFRIERSLRVPSGLDAGNADSRAPGLVDLSVTDWITLRAGSEVIEVRTVVNNTVRDHRVRVLFPSDVSTDTYWSDQPFVWVERPVAIDAASANYKEPDPVERPHHACFAVGDAGGGLAVLCPGGLHEHSVFEDERRTLALTLFRAFHQTVQTDGEPGGQTLEAMEFRYALMPFVGEMHRAGLSNRVMELQAGIVTKFVDSDCGRKGFIQLDAPECVVMTALKPGMDGGSVVMRFWNTGAEEASVQVVFAQSLQVAWLCNLAEEPISQLAVDHHEVRLSVAPRGLATLKIQFEK